MTLRHQIRWTTPAGVLVAVAPRADEVAAHAAVLTAAYNDPHNAPLLGHTELMSEADVRAHYAAVAQDGGRNFLVFCDGALAGDADLRHVAGGAAEIALMVAAVAQQGRGLGTRIALMVSAYGFVQLGLDRIYASIVPANAASRRVFDKLGFVQDDSPTARGYADEPGDVVVVAERTRFAESHADALAALTITVR